MSIFSLSQKSLDTLRDVNPRLTQVVHDAIKTTTVDFTVGEGLRTLERQRELVARGKSKTLKSKHITGHAVDLWALLNGKVSWESSLYNDIAEAMRDSAIKNGVVVRWGAVWDRVLNDIKDTKKEPRLYTERRKAQGKKAFTDSVHFELI